MAVQPIHQLNHMLSFLFLSSEITLKKNNLTLLSSALHHCKSPNNGMLFKGKKSIKYFWFFLAVKRHISSQYLKLDRVYSPECKKKLSCGKQRLLLLPPMLPRLLLKHVESIKCLWPHAEVTLRLSFITLSRQATPSPLLIPFIYATEVVKQKCSKRCWPWPLTQQKRTYKCQTNNRLPSQPNQSPNQEQLLTSNSLATSHEAERKT